MNDTRTGPTPAQTGKTEVEAFCAQTFPHLEAIYSDACCLMRNREDAADLTVDTYFRAFLDYAPFRRRYVSENRQIESARSWLTKHMHAAFCDGILARAGHSKTRTGGRS